MRSFVALLAFTLLAAAATFTVRPGDTLSAVAIRFHVPLSALVRANHITDPDRIVAGEELVIPGATPGAVPAGAAAPAATHVVKRGETLGAIAARSHVSVALLVKANRLANPNRLRVGQVLAVRGAARRATWVCPVAGGARFFDDFGEPRGGLKHQGIDMLAAKRAPAVAVEDGHVEYWTTSKSAGCMLYLYGDSGTMYEYIHLNNDLTAKNDNKGKCAEGTAYSVRDGATVAAGQQIGYVGDSGDANGIHPHLHFEVHPNGKAAIDPFRDLQRAARLLAPAPPTGRMFTLKLTGTVASVTAANVTLTADTVAAWPSHVRQSKLALVVSLELAAGESFSPGERIVAWTQPAPGTIAALTGLPGALTLDRFSDA